MNFLHGPGVFLQQDNYIRGHNGNTNHPINIQPATPRQLANHPWHAQQALKLFKQ